jgi:hypothetical protein
MNIEDIHRDDQLLDIIGIGGTVVPQDTLTVVLTGWRDEIRSGE